MRLEWTAHRNPPRSPRHLPTYVEQATIRTLECPNSGHHTVIYDLLAFCPWCGPDKTPPRAVFEDNLVAQRRLLALVGELPDEARASVEAVGGVTTLTERALTGIVAATQSLAKRLHAQAGKAPPKDTHGTTSIGCSGSGWPTSRRTRSTGSMRPPSGSCDSPSHVATCWSTTAE